MATLLLNPSTPWPSTPKDLCTLLQIKSSNSMKCHGYGKKKPTCGNHVSKANASRIDHLVGLIVFAGQLSGLASLCLQELSGLVLCQNKHQDQAPEKEDVWQLQLTALTPRSRGPAERTRAEGHDRRAAHRREQEADSPQRSRDRPRTAEGVQLSRSSPSAQGTADSTETASPSPSSDRRRRSSSDEPAPPPLTARPIRLRRSPRLANTTDDATPRHPPPPANAHEFVFYGTSRTMAEINETIRSKLLERLAPEDVTGQGYIYGYTFPRTHAVVSGGRHHHSAADDEDEEGYIKIGFTKHLARRMAQWRSTCGYAPAVRFHFPTCHYRVLEKVVHLQLHNARRREKGCPGCGARHLEWFHAREADARHAAALWTDFAAQGPYAADGRLRRAWVARLAEVDLQDPRCWEWFVYRDLDSSPQAAASGEEGEPRDARRGREGQRRRWCDRAHAPEEASNGHADAMRDTGRPAREQGRERCTYGHAIRDLGDAEPSRRPGNRAREAAPEESPSPSCRGGCRRSRARAA